MTDRRKEEIGRAIREARLRKGLTREELAVALRCSYTSIHRWELGKRVPRRVYWDKLKEILGLDLSPGKGLS